MCRYFNGRVKRNIQIKDIRKMKLKKLWAKYLTLNKWAYNFHILFNIKMLTQFILNLGLYTINKIFRLGIYQFQSIYMKKIKCRFHYLDEMCDLLYKIRKSWKNLNLNISKISISKNICGLRLTKNVRKLVSEVVSDLN